MGTLFEFENDPAVTAMTQIMDLQDRVMFAGEMGLLGLAFHPNFAVNGAFYLNSINYAQETVISRFTLKDGDPVATAASEMVMLTWPQVRSRAACLLLF